MPPESAFDKYRVTDYCDTWDAIGAWGIQLGQTKYIKNDQELDDTDYSINSNFLSNPISYFKDLWNYVSGKVEASIGDFFKQAVNLFSFGMPYSHGLENFLNDIDSTGAINKNIAENSDLGFIETLNEYVFLDRNVKETVCDYDFALNNIDTIDAKVDLLNMVLSEDSRDIKVAPNEATDVLAINSWYSELAYQGESLKSLDGSTVLNSQIDQLIQAMATYSTQNAMNWSQAIQEKPEEVNAILAQNWVPQY